MVPFWIRKNYGLYRSKGGLLSTSNLVFCQARFFEMNRCVCIAAQVLQHQ